MFHTHRYLAVSYGILKRPHARGYITVDNGTYFDLRLFTQYDSCNYILKFNTLYAERPVCMHTFVQKGKAVPLQARRGPEGSKKLRFPEFVTTAQDDGRLSALRSGRLYPQEMLLVLISVRD